MDWSKRSRTGPSEKEPVPQKKGPVPQKKEPVPLKKGTGPSKKGTSLKKVIFLETVPKKQKNKFL